MNENERFEHESMGMLELSRSHGADRLLFGSDVKHHEMFHLRLKKACIVFSGGGSRYCADQMLAEVTLSPSQLLDLFSSMNTQGVPCTIKYLSGKSYEEYPQDAPRTFEKVVKESLKNIEGTLQEMKKLEKSVEEVMSSMSQKKREQIKREFSTLINNFQSNYAFYLRSINEAAEHVKEEAKRELSNYVDMLSKQRGVQLNGSVAKLDLEFKSLEGRVIDDS